MCFCHLIFLLISPLLYYQSNFGKWQKHMLLTINNEKKKPMQSQEDHVFVYSSILTRNLSKVGFDCALDNLATQGALPHGGCTVQTADQVTAGQEGGRHVLVTADLTDQGLRQTQKLLL